MITSICHHCEERYDVNPRLNDGYCDYCRAGLNAETYYYRHEDLLDADSKEEEIEPDYIDTV